MEQGEIQAVKQRLPADSEIKGDRYMSRTEVHQYESFTVRYQGAVELEEATEKEAQDFIDRGVEDGNKRDDYEVLTEEVVEIVPPEQKTKPA